jgi:hypothetical protein
VNGTDHHEDVKFRSGNQVNASIGRVNREATRPIGSGHSLGEFESLVPEGGNAV